MTEKMDKTALLILRRVRKAIKKHTLCPKEQHVLLDQLYHVLSGKNVKGIVIDPFVTPLMNITLDALDEYVANFPEVETDSQKNALRQKLSHLLQFTILRLSCKQRTKFISIALGIGAAAVSTTVAVFKATHDKPDKPL